AGAELGRRPQQSRHDPLPARASGRGDREPSTRGPMRPRPPHGCLEPGARPGSAGETWRDGRGFPRHRAASPRSPGGPPPIGRSASEPERAGRGADLFRGRAQPGLGLVLVRLKRFDEAIRSLRRAIEIEPEEPGASAILAKALSALGRFDESLGVYETLLRLRPDDAGAHHNRGFVLDELRRCDEAVASYDRAIRLAPGHAEAHHNRGVVLGKLARYDEAIASFEEAIHVEQGLGDTIQFIRYASLVKDRGGRVVVECQKPLVRLLETCSGIDQVVARGEALPEFDFHTPLLRLMGLFTTTLETIPASIPYLTAEGACVERWRERLRAWPGFRIGIAWQGNPRHTRDPDRSIRLAQFERLAGIEGIRLISLQKGFGAEQLRELGDRLSVIDLGEEVDPGLTTMWDTPALMMGLDLVITPDTSLARLAGALGTPVWIALP